MAETKQTTTLQLIDEHDTGQVLQVSEAALRRWRREGKGPAYVRCGRCIRYSLKALEEYIAANSSR